MTSFLGIACNLRKYLSWRTLQQQLTALSITIGVKISVLDVYGGQGCVSVIKVSFFIDMAHLLLG